MCVEGRAGKIPGPDGATDDNRLDLLELTPACLREQRKPTFHNLVRVVGCRVSGSGFLVPDFGFRAVYFLELTPARLGEEWEPALHHLDPDFRESGFGFRVSDFGVPVSGFRFRGPGCGLKEVSEKVGMTTADTMEMCTRDTTIRHKTCNPQFRTMHNLPPTPTRQLSKSITQKLDKTSDWGGGGLG